MKLRFFKSSTYYWLNLIVSTLIILSIFSFLEVISWNHNQRFDLTPTKRYTLSPYTKNLLSKLPHEVKVTVFYQRDQLSEFIDLLRQYEAASPKFRYEFYNLDSNPGKAEQYGVTSYGATVIEYEGKMKVYPYCTEENITNGILTLYQKRTRKIYFLQGHGENNPEDTDERKGYSILASHLTRENYEVKPLTLLYQTNLPSDTSLLVISGPKMDLIPKELKMLSEYLKRGGKILFMIDPYTVPGLVKFLSTFGIILGNDMIVDQEGRAFAGDALSPIIASYRRKHEIFKNFEGAAIMPLTRSVDIKEDINPEIEVKTLARSGPESYAKIDRGMIERGHLYFEKGKDRKGPIPVMAVGTFLTGEESGEIARIAVIGCSNFVNNMYINLLGNKDLILNTINWLVGEEKLISVRPQEKQLYPFSFLFLTDRQMRIIFWVTVVIQPSLLLIIGIVIYVRRRIRG